MPDREKKRVTNRRLRSLRNTVQRYGSAYLYRLTTPFRPQHVLPDFLVIGAMKCGTTALFDYLQQHPGICTPRRKEIHFFSNPRFYRLGEAWYRGNFPTGKDMERLSRELGYRAITGEATPAMISRLYAINASKHIPDARLIVVLRNPVDRAYSHYHHNKHAFFGEPLDFWDALQAEAERTSSDMAANREKPADSGKDHRRYSYTQRGMYIDQIEHWLRYYPRQQLKILNYHDLAADPAAFCDDVTRFLELPEHEFVISGKRNTGDYSQSMDEHSREYLTELFRPYNRRLFDFLGDDWGWPS